MVKKATPTRKQNVIYDQLKEDIINGKYDGGTFLLESDLCKEFNVSRTPVREALILLAHDQYIEMIPNRGAFVPQITIKDIKELYELRIANDGMAAFLCTEFATPTVIQAMEESIAREANYLASEDFFEAAKEEFLFHSLYVNNCGNQRLIHVIDSVSHQMMRAMWLGADKNAQMVPGLHYHSELVDAMKARDPSRARTIMDAHWQNNKQGYIRRYVEGTISNKL